MKVSSCVLVVGAVLSVLVNAEFLSGLFPRRGLSYGGTAYRLPRSPQTVQNSSPYDPSYNQTPDQPDLGENPASGGVFQRVVESPIRRLWQIVIKYFELIFKVIMDMNLMGIGAPWHQHAWTVMEWIVNKIVDGIDTVLAAPTKIPGISILYYPIYIVARFLVRTAAFIFIYPAKITLKWTINLVWCTSHIVGNIITLIWRIPLSVAQSLFDIPIKVFGLMG